MQLATERLYRYGLITAMLAPVRSAIRRISSTSAVLAAQGFSTMIRRNPASVAARSADAWSSAGVQMCTIVLIRIDARQARERGRAADPPWVVSIVVFETVQRAPGSRFHAVDQADDRPEW